MKNRTKDIRTHVLNRHKNSHTYSTTNSDNNYGTFENSNRYLIPSLVTAKNSESIIMRNIHNLSRTLNPSPVRLDSEQSQHTTQSVQELEDMTKNKRLLLARRFVQQVQSDPVGLLGTVSQMIRLNHQHHLASRSTSNNTPPNYQSQPSSCLLDVLQNCFERWLAVCLEVYFTEDLLYFYTLKNRMNKLGTIFIKVFQGYDQGVYETLMKLNINYLQLVEEAYRSLMCLVISDNSLLTEYLMNLMREREVYFLWVLVELVRGCEERLTLVKDIRTLAFCIEDYQLKNEYNLIERVVRSEVLPIFRERCSEYFIKFEL